MKSKVLFSLLIISTFVTYNAHGMHRLTQAAARMATRRVAAQKFRMPQFTTQRFRIPQQSLQWRRMCTEQRQEGNCHYCKQWIKEQKKPDITESPLYQFSSVSLFLGVWCIFFNVVIPKDEVRHGEMDVVY